jgi:signal transduction histidine kinase
MKAAADEYGPRWGAWVLPYRPVLTIAALAALVTGVVALPSSADLAYRSRGLHVALETTATLVAALVAYLALSRFRLDPSRRSLLLGVGLALLALCNFAFAALPAAIPSIGVNRGAAWAATAGGLFGAAVLAAGGLAAARVPRPRAVVAGLAASVAALVAIGGTLLFFDSRLPAVTSSALRLGESTAHLEAHPAFLAMQLSCACLFAVAAVGFARRGARGDALMRWVGAAMVLGAFARVNYFFFPTRYTEWIYSGDLMRLAMYSLLLVGAVREIQRYVASLTTVAMLEDRRRLAREFHDGLAQEVAYIAMQTRRLIRGGTADAATLALLIAAADRALEETRMAISALRREFDEPLDAALRRTAERIADREGLRHGAPVEVAVR